MNLLLRPPVASITLRVNGCTISCAIAAGLSLDKKVTLPLIGISVELAMTISLETVFSKPGTPGQNHEEVD